jgi:4-hydroxy-tetrahydrodipicolinate reductase
VGFVNFVVWTFVETVRYMKLLLVGYGKMGRLVGELAGQYECEVAGIVDPLSPSHSVNLNDDRWREVDVAIDFSFPDAVPANLPALARLGLNVVIGTTGWSRHEAELREVVDRSGIGVVAAPNFSAGVVMFEAIVAHAAGLAAKQADFGAWLHETHHAMKKDAPSGTALLLKSAMERAGYARPIDVASTRAGHVPGTHTIGFDGPAESITLSHSARDRSAFARGALQAARWITGKRGWFSMRDVLGI